MRPRGDCEPLSWSATTLLQALRRSRPRSSTAASGTCSNAISGSSTRRLHERQILLENAPHLVIPLPFLIPLFGRDGVVNKAVSRTYSTALWMYDLTGGWRIGKRHEQIGRDAALSHLADAQRPKGSSPRSSTTTHGLMTPGSRSLSQGRLRSITERCSQLRRCDRAAAPQGRPSCRRQRACLVSRLCGRRWHEGHRSQSLRRHKRDRRVDRRRKSPRRSDASPFTEAGKGNPRHRAAQPVARRHRCSHSGTC